MISTLKRLVLCLSFNQNHSRERDVHKPLPCKRMCSKKGYFSSTGMGSHVCAALCIAVDIKLLHCMQGQGKGARPTEKCGVCVHCTRPALRKGCLNPIVKSENPDEAYDLAAK